MIIPAWSLTWEIFGADGIALYRVSCEPHAKLYAAILGLDYARVGEGW